MTTAKGTTKGPKAPELVTRRFLREHHGLTPADADRVMRRCPEAWKPAHTLYVRRSDAERVLADSRTAW